MTAPTQRPAGRPARLMPPTRGEDRFEAGPGSFVFLPRGRPHTFRSVNGAATGLLIVTPGGLDEYFAELHDVISSNSDRSEIAKVQAKYGIVRS